MIYFIFDNLLDVKLLKPKERWCV